MNVMKAKKRLVCDLWEVNDAGRVRIPESGFGTSHEVRAPTVHLKLLVTYVNMSWFFVAPFISCWQWTLSIMSWIHCSWRLKYCKRIGYTHVASTTARLIIPNAFKSLLLKNSNNIGNNTFKKHTTLIKMWIHTKSIEKYHTFSLKDF